MFLNGEENVESRPFRQCTEGLIRGGFGRILLNLAAAHVTKCLSGSGVKQAEVIVKLGLRGDGGTRVLGRILLPNRYRRGKTADLVHVGLVHAFEELAGVSGERF